MKIMVPDLDMRRFTDFKDNLRLKWGYDVITMTPKFQKMINL